MRKHKCHFCETENSKVSQHHINGKGLALDIKERDNNPENLIYLCIPCHDRVEGICSKCADRESCNRIKFQECWIFEDAFPPKYFRTQKQAIIDSFLSGEVKEAKCPECRSSNIARISIWRYTGIYIDKPSFRAVYKCKKCKNKFQRRLEGYLERANDNKAVPIEIKNFHSYEEVLLG